MKVVREWSRPSVLSPRSPGHWVFLAYGSMKDSEGYEVWSAADGRTAAQAVQAFRHNLRPVGGSCNRFGCQRKPLNVRSKL